MPVYRITIGDRTYEVTIVDPFASPVRATVDGQDYTVEVASDAGQAGWQAAAPALSEAPVPPHEPVPPSALAAAPPPSGAADQAVLAPMPGKVLSVAVKVGDRVQPGQEVAMLEAMKMAMAVRASAAGTVRQVLIDAGQSVRNGETLVIIGAERS